MSPDRSGVQPVVDAVQRECSGLILVNVLGGAAARSAALEALTDEEWAKDLDLNFFPVVGIDRALIPGIAQGSGVVVQVNAIQSRLPLPEAATGYAAPRAISTPIVKASVRKFLRTARG